MSLNFVASCFNTKPATLTVSRESTVSAVKQQIKGDESSHQDSILRPALG